MISRREPEADSVPCMGEYESGGGAIFKFDQQLAARLAGVPLVRKSALTVALACHLFAQELYELLYAPRCYRSCDF